MALRNAFENIMTERTGRLILNAVTFARDLNDRLRVVVDGGSISVTSGPYMAGSTTTGTYRTWNEASAVFMVDQREVQRQASLVNGEISRQRWTYS